MVIGEDAVQPVHGDQAHHALGRRAVGVDQLVELRDDQAAVGALRHEQRERHVPQPVHVELAHQVAQRGALAGGAGDDDHVPAGSAWTMTPGQHRVDQSPELVGADELERDGLGREPGLSARDLGGRDGARLVGRKDHEDAAPVGRPPARRWRTRLRRRSARRRGRSGRGVTSETLTWTSGPMVKGRPSRSPSTALATARRVGVGIVQADIAGPEQLRGASGGRRAGARPPPARWSALTERSPKGEEAAPRQTRAAAPGDHEGQARSRR